MKNKIIMILQSAFVLFLGMQCRAEVFDLFEYPSQHPVIDSLRTEMFYVDDSKKLADELNPWYRNFYTRGSVRSVAVLGDGHPELEYKFWMQDKPSTLMVILPGLGGHFAGGTLTALAELFYKNGFSVLGLSSAMNWQFMEAAGTVYTPGYTPQDALDVHNALRKVLQDLQERRPGMVKDVMLCGYSLGAAHVLFISAFESRKPEIGFSRYLAVNPPVDLLYGMNMVDEFYAIGGNWTAAQVSQKIEKSSMIYLMLMNHKLVATKKLDFEIDEAKFLIGFSFHMNLREMIFSIYRRKDFGFIKAPYSWFDRTKLYHEIDTFSYGKYVNTFLLTEYSRLWKRNVSVAELDRNSNLHAIGNELAKNRKVRIIHSMDDFLVSDADRRWLAAIMGDRIVFFSKGGHLGNLYYGKVQSSIIDAVRDTPPPATTRQ